MQRQKTIAKWLSVILLLSVALACYIAISTVLKNKETPSNNIAGADTNQPSTQDTVVTPIYSTLPRKGENVANLFVRHIGGENDEKLLDTLYLNNKRYIIFLSQSTQYDVRGVGMYIAVLDENSVESITKLAQDDEEYVASTITKGGLLIVTQNASETHLRLMSSTLATNAICTTKRYRQLALYSHANEVFALTYDGQFLRQAQISQSLDFVQSNFVYEEKNASIQNVLAYGENTLIFLNTSNCCKFLSFDATNGFLLKNEMINCKIMQMLPIHSNGSQLFFTLLERGDAMGISCFSTSFQLLAQYDVDSANCGVLLPCESGVALYQDNTIFTFCVHLDLLWTASCTTKLDSQQILQIDCVDGANDMFVVRTLTEAKLCKLVEKDIQIVFECNIDDAILDSDDNGADNSALSHFIVQLQPTTIGDKSYSLCILFSAPTTNSFAYMCYGKRDIFVINI